MYDIYTSSMIDRYIMRHPNARNDHYSTAIIFPFYNYSNNDMCDIYMVSKYTPSEKIWSSLSSPLNGTPIFLTMSLSQKYIIIIVIQCAIPLYSHMIVVMLYDPSILSLYICYTRNGSKHVTNGISPSILLWLISYYYTAYTAMSWQPRNNGCKIPLSYHYYYYHSGSIPYYYYPHYYYQSY